MRKTLLLTAAALAVVATPAAARDGSGYFGIEGGLLFPKDQDADLNVDYTTTNVVVGGGTVPANTPAGPADTEFNNAFGLDYKRGIDLDAIIGYDFGAFRVEGELAYKRTKLNEVEFDSGDLAAINAALNRPAGTGDPVVPGNPAIVAADYDLGGRATVLSGMVNALADFGDENGVSFYAGGGFGRARLRAFGDSDSAWAWQLIAGVRYAISPNIDLGLKYRYFRTGNMELADETIALPGNANALTVTTPNGPVIVNQTTNAVAFADYENKFRTHSLLASLIFNFGAAAEAPLPPPPPPPPVVEAPATQTCPDGSVILATISCPLPPPPPPPPPVERGERGQ
jgi:opacity protein-like surface antigen